MKIDVYCFLKESPSRFEIKASWLHREPMTYLKVLALPEMDDEQVLRQALDNISFFLKRLEIIGAMVAVHLDSPLDFDGEKVIKSIDRLRALLVKPKDLQFEVESYEVPV